MKRISTVSELRQAWQTIFSVLWRDVGLASRLASDPVGTLRELGYEVAPEARAALLRALP